MKRPKMPESVSVGVHSYRIARRPNAKNLGDMDYNNLVINVRARLRQSMAQSTLLHEVLHACCTTMEVDRQEEFIEAIEGNLLYVIQNNPDLLEYLRTK